MAGNPPRASVRGRNRGFEASPSVLLIFACGGSLSKGLFNASCLPSHDRLARNALWGYGEDVFFRQSQTWAPDFCLLLPDQRRCEAPEDLAPELHHLPKARYQAEHPAPESQRGESAACFCQSDTEGAENTGKVFFLQGMSRLE